MKTMITAVMLLISTIAISQVKEIPFDRMMEVNTWTGEEFVHSTQGGKIKIDGGLIWVYHTNGLPSLYYLVREEKLDGGHSYHLLDKNRVERGMMLTIGDRAAIAFGDWVTIYNYELE
jgi:hypothetical protein